MFRRLRSADIGINEQTGDSMSRRFHLLICGSTLMAALPLVGCRSTIEVRTIGAPDVGLTQMRSFRILPAPTRRDGRAMPDDDPMIDNSIANHAIRARIARSFEELGYRADDRAPDFVVAFYATAREKLDMAIWDYGYPSYPRWPQYPSPVPAMTQYTEGTVVVDVLEVGTRALLWRGEGKAALSNEPSENVRRLADVASAIVAKFPHAGIHVVAARQ
jgi:hypothetical protein